MSDRGDKANARPDEELIDATAIDQAESRHDEDDRLRPEYVTAVLDAVEDGDAERARDLVSPLHPADIAEAMMILSCRGRGSGPHIEAIKGDGRLLWIRRSLPPPHCNSSVHRRKHPHVTGTGQ